MNNLHQIKNEKKKKAKNKGKEKKEREREMRRQKMKDKVIKENRKRRDFPGATAVKAPLLNCRRLCFDPWVQKIP